MLGLKLCATTPTYIGYFKHLVKYIQSVTTTTTTTKPIDSHPCKVHVLYIKMPLNILLESLNLFRTHQAPPNSWTRVLHIISPKSSKPISSGQILLTLLSHLLNLSIPGRWPSRFQPSPSLWSSTPFTPLFPRSSLLALRGQDTPAHLRGLSATLLSWRVPSAPPPPQQQSASYPLLPCPSLGSSGFQPVGFLPGQLPQVSSLTLSLESSPFNCPDVPCFPSRLS